jgi:hypothetical protein
LLTTLAAPLLFGGLVLAFMHQGSERSLFVGGTSAWESLYVVVPVAFVAAVATFGSLNSWSLHAIYRARLNDAFNLERTLVTEGPPKHSKTVVEASPRSDPVPLSKLKLTDFPEVLICATSNIRNYGLVPTGFGAAPFLFSQDRVGGPVVGHLYTHLYEAACLRSTRSLTVMDAVSISGAAVAPEMGRMTRAPLRFLMALANIRLGVWIPKPSAAEAKIDKRLDTLSSEITTGTKPKRRIGVVKPPGLLYLWREAFGATPQSASHVYVTDGGHYDNLGLVELLKNRCDWIWCIDASGDDIGTFSTLGEALAIAEAEFGITVVIDPVGKMAPADAKTRFVKQPFCTGDITYPPKQPGGKTDTGKLVVVKAGVTQKAPWAVGYYHASDLNFPCDTTLDQLYTAQRFDAYVALGKSSMNEAYTDPVVMKAYDDNILKRWRDLG